LGGRLNIKIFSRQVCGAVFINLLVLRNGGKMTNKLHTSRQTQEIFSAIAKAEGLQPYILSKLAIALSVRKGKITAEDCKMDNDGLELSRQTIFGGHDLLFKALIIHTENREINEEEYFPGIVKGHLDRGAKLLENEKRYSKDFYNHLCRLDSNL